MTDTQTRSEDSTLRPVRVELWFPRGPEISWQLLSLRGTEALSEAYVFELELACEDEDAEIDAMLGADVELLFDRNGLTRVFYGVIAEVHLGLGSLRLDDELGRRARARVVPAFRLLEHGLDTRFFIGQSVVEILESRLGEALEPFGRTLDTSRLRARYERRDYCVQFRESTYDFCRRLMAEEGIAFMFEPDDQAHCERLVLIDDNAAYEAAELLAPDGLAFAPHEAELLDRESIAELDWRHQRRPNRVVRRGYNFKLPMRREEGEAEGFDPHHHRVRADYRHDLRRQVVDDPVDDPRAETFTGGELDQRGVAATTQLERYQVEAGSGSGLSNAIGFGAGRTFELDEARDVTGGEHELLLVRVVHEAVRQDGGDHRYVNRFACGLRSTRFRPPLTKAKPRVQGVLTGRVVGPAQDEVHTDSHGRIKVQLHGDRHGEGDEHASCWIRVAQMWAGAGYGALVIPRVGMEVVVSFVGGDPDQPLVTGCVYNGDHPPPVSLPEGHSQSTFKSSSTPGGEGFNELRVDDAEGREKIFVRAQRRMDVRVGGSLYETAVGNREEVVGFDREDERQHNTMVYGERNLRVTGKQYEYRSDESYLASGKSHERLSGHKQWVAGSAELNAERRVVEASELISHKSDTIELAGSTTLSVKGGGRVVVESNNKLEFRVGQSFIVIGPDRIDLQGTKVRINSGGRVGEASDGQELDGFEMPYPLMAFAADDGRPGSGSGSGGSGGRRERQSLTLDPFRPPPMEPPPPLPGGTEDARRALDRPLRALAWAAEEVWCSEPVEIEGRLARMGEPYVDNLRLLGGESGATLGVEIARVGAGEEYRQTIALTDVLPRATAQGSEERRGVLAELGDVRTTAPLALRFLTKLESLTYQTNYGRFDVAVNEGEVVIGGAIKYVRGWLHYIITLGDHVPADTGGRIGGKYFGTEDLRYCKADHAHGGKHGLVFWDGMVWKAVPESWTNPLGTKLHGCAIWTEGGQVRRQFGKTLDWPDEVPAWSARAVADKDAELTRCRDHIESWWSGEFDLKRSACLGEDPRCCRHAVSCEVHFVEVESKTKRGIVIAENDTRANSEAWPLRIDEHTAAHEYGHHLGNPDEYAGAGSVDPSVNGDGAVAGIDEEGVMGEGYIVRRRHYKFIAKALDKLVSERLAKDFNYTVVDCLP